MRNGPEKQLAGLAVSDEGFAFDPHTGRSFTLNATGRRLLRALAEGDSPEQAAAALAERYAVDLRAVRGDVRDFIEQLRAEQLWESAS